MYSLLAIWRNCLNVLSKNILFAFFFFHFYKKWIWQFIIGKASRPRNIHSLNIFVLLCHLWICCELFLIRENALLTVDLTVCWFDAVTTEAAILLAKGPLLAHSTSLSEAWNFTYRDEMGVLSGKPHALSAYWELNSTKVSGNSYIWSIAKDTVSSALVCFIFLFYDLFCINQFYFANFRIHFALVNFTLLTPGFILH